MIVSDMSFSKYIKMQILTQDERVFLFILFGQGSNLSLNNLKLHKS